jgi:hypothetical protein
MDVALLPLAAALALEPEAAPITSEPAEFQLSLALDAWLPRLEGDFTDAGAKVDVRTIDLHDAAATFAGALTMTRDRLDVTIRGFSFSTDGGGVATTPSTLGGITISTGDTFTSDFSWWSAGLEIAYDIYRPLAERPTAWSDPRANWEPAANATDFSVFLLLSADIDAMSRTISDATSGLSTDANESFAAFEVGLGFHLGFDTSPTLPILRRIDIGAEAAYGLSVPTGGGDLGGASRVEANISAWFCQEGAVYFGYRLVGGSFEGDDMSLDGSLQGLHAGIRLAF